MAANSSTKKTKGVRNFNGIKFSLKNIAVPMPKGTAIIRVIKELTKVP